MEISNKSLWAGKILTILVTLFLTFDIVIHFLRIAPVVESFNQLGIPLNLAIPIAIIELVCLVLYLFPRTSILGAILLTGYLGGAVLTNLRAGTPLFSHVLFPVYTGMFLWGGIYFRNQKLQELIPLVK